MVLNGCTSRWPSPVSANAAATAVTRPSVLTWSPRTVSAGLDALWWCLAGAAVAATAKASETDAAREPKERKNMNEIPKGGWERGNDYGASLRARGTPVQQRLPVFAAPFTLPQSTSFVRSGGCEKSGGGWPLWWSMTGGRAAAGHRVDAAIMDDRITIESAPVALPATPPATVRADARRTRGAARRGPASQCCSRRPRGRPFRAHSARRGCPARFW